VARRQAQAPCERSDGMHRIDIGGTPLGEESDNVVTVGTRSLNENVEINIQVPFDTSLKLHDVKVAKSRWTICGRRRD